MSTCEKYFNIEKTKEIHNIISEWKQKTSCLNECKKMFEIFMKSVICVAL